MFCIPFLLAVINIPESPDHKSKPLKSQCTNCKNNFGDSQESLDITFDKSKSFLSTMIKESNYKPFLAGLILMCFFQVRTISRLFYRSQKINILGDSLPPVDREHGDVVQGDGLVHERAPCLYNCRHGHRDLLRRLHAIGQGVRQEVTALRVLHWRLCLFVQPRHLLLPEGPQHGGLAEMVAPGRLFDLHWFFHGKTLKSLQSADLICLF